MAAGNTEFLQAGVVNHVVVDAGAHQGFAWVM